MQKYILPKSSVVCGIGKNCLESFEVHMFPYEPIQFFRNGFVQKSISPSSGSEMISLSDLRSCKKRRTSPISGH